MIKLTSQILAIVLFCTACSKSQESNEEREDYSSGQSISIKSDRTVLLKEDRLITAHTARAPHRFQRMNRDYLHEDSLLYYKHENKVVELNLGSGELNEIVIPAFELNSDISYVMPIGEDSLLLIERLQPKVMIVSRSGEVVYKKNLPFADFTIDNTWMKGIFMTYGEEDANFNLSLHRSIHYDESSKELHIPIMPVDYILSGDMERTETIGVFSIEDSKWSRFYGKARGLMSLRGDKNYGHVFDRNYFLVKGDTTFISYPISHQVFMVNNQTDELLAEFQAHPEDPAKIPEPVDKGTLTNGANREKLLKWRNNSPFYDELNYHEDLDLFTRIYYGKRQEDLLEGYYFHDRKASMLVFNSDFELLSEIALNSNEFELGKYLPTSDGYIVAPSDFREMAEESSDFQLGYKNYLKLIVQE